MQAKRSMKNKEPTWMGLCSRYYRWGHWVSSNSWQCNGNGGVSKDSFYLNRNCWSWQLNHHRSNTLSKKRGRGGVWGGKKSLSDTPLSLKN